MQEKNHSSLSPDLQRRPTFRNQSGNTLNRTFKNHSRTALLASDAVATVALLAACGRPNMADKPADPVAQGKQIFHFDTFGDETQWTDTLRMHEFISAAVDSATALSVGLKVDVGALPIAVVQGIQNGNVDMKSPATTVALCHSTVDNSFAPDIRKRLDGWANRDLNPGAITALSPAMDAATKAALNAWGKGKFDPHHNIDGISKPAVIPPAYGLEGIHRVTVTGDCTEIAYWNRYAAVVEMGGYGSFTEPCLNLKVTHGSDDQVTSKLPALQAYQLSLPAPAGSFDTAAAMRGKSIFNGAEKCIACHSGAQFTDANAKLHSVDESMAEPETPSYFSRSASKQYRTSPLKGLWQHASYFHDRSAAMLRGVANRYKTWQSLGLNTQQLDDLTEYLKSL